MLHTKCNSPYMTMENLGAKNDKADIAQRKLPIHNLK